MKATYLMPILLLLPAAAAQAADTGQPADQAGTAAPEPVKERMICKTSIATGSLTRRRRTCMTAAQWNEEAERARKSVDSIASNAYRRVGETQDTPGPR